MVVRKGCACKPSSPTRGALRNRKIKNDRGPCYPRGTRPVGLRELVGWINGAWHRPCRGVRFVECARAPSESSARRMHPLLAPWSDVPPTSNRRSRLLRRMPRLSACWFVCLLRCGGAGILNSQKTMRGETPVIDTETVIYWSRGIDTASTGIFCDPNRV